MPPPNTSKSILDPNLTDAMRALKLDIFRSLNCVKLGKIVTFDSTKKTAQVQILFKRQLPDGTSVSNPLLVDVPVFTLQGGGGAIQFPILPGDQCLLIFSDRNIDAWYQNGQETVPFTNRAHDLSDGIALIGVNPLTSKLAANPTLEAKFSYSGGSVSINALGFVSIKSPTQSLALAMSVFLTAVAGATSVAQIAAAAAVLEASLALLLY